MKNILFVGLCALILFACNKDEVADIPIVKEEFNTTFQFIREANPPLYSYNFTVEIFRPRSILSVFDYMSNWYTGRHDKWVDTLSLKTTDNLVAHRYMITLNVKDGQNQFDYTSRSYRSDTLSFKSKNDTLIEVRYPQDTLTFLKRFR